MVYAIDPLTDARWSRFLAKHAAASVFHTPGWLGALRRTYGYEPFVLTTAASQEELKNGIALCRVRSWLTGDRIVSVPFADHCQPLLESTEDLQALLDALKEEQVREQWKYVELRPLVLGGEGEGEALYPPQPIGISSLQGGRKEVRASTSCHTLTLSLLRVRSSDPDGTSSNEAAGHCRDYGPCLCASIRKSFGKSDEFYFHSLDLRPDADSLFQNFHKSCVQRKIQRAEREQLSYEVGCSKPFIEKFHHLLLLTRRRHQLPPQPLAWFQNLLDCLGDQAKIHLISKDGLPIASILTLFFKNTLFYKYGCSDVRFHRLGGMPLVFWKAIQEGKQLGAKEFDLGRSDTNNPGLVEFKRHLGAVCSTLNYYRYPPRASSSSALSWKMRVAREAFKWLPDSLLRAAGKSLYKHVG